MCISTVHNAQINLDNSNMIIGIGGVSMAGKSTLANKLKSIYSDQKICILCQDDFSRPSKEIPLIKNKTDWENPASLDFNSFIASLKARNTEYELVVAEGLFAFYDSALSNLYDKKIFIDIPKQDFFDRKRKDKRWGVEPEWYVKHIWESYLNYGMVPDGQHDVLRLDGTQAIDIDKLMNYLDN